MQGTHKNCLQNFDPKMLKDEASWGPRVCIDRRKGLAYLKKKSVALCSGFNWLKICSNGSNDHSGSKYMHNFVISSATISLSTKTLFNAVTTVPKDHVTTERHRISLLVVRTLKRRQCFCAVFGFNDVIYLGPLSVVRISCQELSVGASICQYLSSCHQREVAAY